MANPNVEVWGDSSTWRQEQRLPAAEGTGYNILKATKPRIATFATNDGSLAAGNAAGKTLINKSLDATICPCGQDAAISPFAKIRMFKNHNSAALNVVPEQTIINNDVCNWFLYEGVNGYYYSWNTNHYNESGGGFRWLPSANINNNLNSSIVPYVYWMTKSLLIDVTLYYITGYSSSGIPSYNKMRLADWAANPTRKVADISLQFKGIDSASLTGISYKTGTAANLSSGWGGIAYIGKLYNDIEHYAMYTQGTQLGMTVFGHCEGSSYASSAMFVMNSADMFDGAEIKAAYQQYNTQNGWSLWWEIPYSEDNAKKVLSIAALFGCPFTPYDKNTFNVDFTDTELYLPVIDDNGIAHGEYTHGSENASNPFNSKDSVRDYDYDPSKPVDPNRYSDHTTLPALSDVGQYYWTDKTLGSIDQKINIGNIIDVITDLADNPYNEDFIFQEPLKCVLDYRRIFLTQPWERAVSESPIVLGRFYSNVVGKPFVGYANPPRYRRITLGSWDFYRTYNNFLDFEPYTQAILYVPYCGVKKLPMDIFAGHTVNVYMNADNCTGELQVLIFVDNIEWGTMSGMASEELPLISEESLTAANTKRQLTYQKDVIDMKSNLGVLGSLAGASISAAMHNPLGVALQGGSALFKKLESSFEIGEINYQINHTVPDPLTIQKGNAAIDKCNVLYPFVMLQTPKFINAETTEEINSLISNYGKTKGFKCCLEGIIGDFHGFTKCSNAILDGISCTYTEKTMILQALQDGVIL